MKQACIFNVRHLLYRDCYVPPSFIRL